MCIFIYYVVNGGSVISAAVKTPNNKKVQGGYQNPAGFAGKTAVS